MTYHMKMAAHDGYAPHSHEVRPDHAGVARGSALPVPPPLTPQNCRLCGHIAPHHPHPDGEGWPATKLKCAACPDGTCELPAPASDALTPEQHYAEAARLLYAADDLLQDDSVPRGPLELGVLALGHAITALAGDDLAPVRKDPPELYDGPPQP